MTDTNVAIVGAGPYGLAAATHLRRAGVDVHVIGQPMSFWQNMPVGLVLRSNWTATCIAEPQGELTLDSFCAATGASFGRPVPLDRFVEYGLWVQQQVAPDVDKRLVKEVEAGPEGFRLTLDDGAALTACRVVVAAGIELFASRPAFVDKLPSELASHTGEHRDLGRFSGSVPDLFRRLPRGVQEPLAYRAIRPAGADWLRPRLTEIPIRLGRTVVSATPRDGKLDVTFADGDTQVVDHLLFGTGYRVDVTRYPFLTDTLTARIRRAGGYPLLTAGMESSVAGLHFLGAPAAWSFGPIMRFVSGGWYTGRALARAIAGPSRLAGAAEPTAMSAGAGQAP
jgi:cation diffusion facilitator CzcD-associated flavoprotein CzcO